MRIGTVPWMFTHTIFLFHGQFPKLFPLDIPQIIPPDIPQIIPRTFPRTFPECFNENMTVFSSLSGERLMF